MISAICGNVVSMVREMNLAPAPSAKRTGESAAFVEIFQNCLVYNDDVFADFTEKSVAKSRQLLLRHGQPMLFGEDGNQGLKLRPGSFDIDVVTVGEDGTNEADILVHDETNVVMAGMLANLSGPDYPQPLGVIYCDPGDTFDAAYAAQSEAARKAAPGP